MRCIDADALEKEGWSLHRTIRVDKNTEEYQTKPLKQVPTIEPRCETCEAFNKTRLLIPQPQRTGRWIFDENDYLTKCSECGCHPWFGVIPTVKEATKKLPHCPMCLARMEGD